MVKVKICGLSEPEHAIAACQAGADFIGLVFASSRRRVAGEKALEIVKALEDISPRPEVVGVFANQDINEVNRTAEDCRLDRVQLSGKESWSYCNRVCRPVIKVIHVSAGMTAGDVMVRMKADSRFQIDNEIMFLLDSKTEEKWGGTGRMFNWQIAHEISLQSPVLIAGGLDPDNVEQLIEQVNPWGVDVSSGVETNGIKDIAKIRAFIRKVKDYRER